jgi:hypothetical protein
MASVVRERGCGGAGEIAAHVAPPHSTSRAEDGGHGDSKDAHTDLEGSCGKCDMSGIPFYDLPTPSGYFKETKAKKWKCNRRACNSEVH